MQDNIGYVISVNTFFSMSTKSNVAAEFASCGGGRPFCESVIFELTIDPNKDESSTNIRPYAQISEYCCNKDECEVFSLQWEQPFK